MATYSSVLAWRIPGTGEPDRLPSMGSHSSPSFRFLMNVHTVSYSGGSNLYSHQQYTKVLFSPHPILVSSLFDDSHSNKGEVIPHCGFDLHFPND